MAKKLSKKTSRKKLSKKTTAKKAASKPTSSGGITSGVSEAAHQIWLAGLGALSRAQEEGSKFYSTLIEEGKKLESNTREAARSGVESVKSQAENATSQAKGTVTDAWDKLENVFEKRVQKSLHSLGVPNRSDIKELHQQIENLQKSVEALKKKK